HEGRESNTAIETTTCDFNLDTESEICLRNRKLAAYFAPHAGGMMYELDLFGIRHNVLSTLSRRAEVYHETILQMAGAAAGQSTVNPVADQARFKQLGLERLLHYDPYPRKSLIDHFYAPEVKLDDVMALRAVEQGNFVSAGYDSDVRKASGRVE